MKKSDKKIFRDITTLENFTEDGNGYNKVNRIYVKEELLNSVVTAIFFDYCEFYELTNNECLFLIQIISHNTFHAKAERLFSTLESKEKMISIWEIIKKYYTNKLFYYFYDDYTIMLTNGMLKERLEKPIRFGKPKDAKIYEMLKEFEKGKINNEKV